MTQPPSPTPSLAGQVWTALRRGRKPALLAGLALLLILAAALILSRPREAAPAPPAPAAASAPLAPPVGPTLALLAARLPEGSRLARIEGLAGEIAATIETIEPDALRARLSGWRVTGERPVADRGVAVSLTTPAERATALTGRPGFDPRRARHAGLLTEPAPPGRIALSGDAARLLALIATQEAAGRRFADWRLERVAGQGAARLTGTPAAGPAIRPLPLAAAALLFGGDAAASDGVGPDLAGIVGRLGRDAVALVRAADGRTRPVAPGGTIDGWRLDSLGADAALFSRGAERVRVPVPMADPVEAEPTEN